MCVCVSSVCGCECVSVCMFGISTTMKCMNRSKLLSLVFSQASIYISVVLIQYSWWLRLEHQYQYPSVSGQRSDWCFQLGNWITAWLDSIPVH